jgi:hypothetical protein
VSLLWADDWYDGPIAGIASRGQRYYWFQARFDEATGNFEEPRRLYVYELTADEFGEESKRHRQFEEIVGDTRICHHLPPAERHGPIGDERRWAKFYDEDKKRTPPQYEHRPAVGWFPPP